MAELTVFTPTYNRAALLKRVYDSLRNQTCKDFVWLIVDDGSTDDTKEAVESFAKEDNGFTIEYAYRENGGKMRAHNMGVKLTKTDWFMCLDSDDYLPSDSVETIIGYINKYNNGSYDTDIAATAQAFAGIIAHKGKSATELLSEVEFPKAVMRNEEYGISSLYNLYRKGFFGETTIVFRREVIAKYPFPEIEGEKYVPEDYIYDKIDAEYVYLVVKKILTVCEIVTSGYTDSVTRLRENNKQAWFLYYEQRSRITPMSVHKLKLCAFYLYFARKTGKKIPFKYYILGLPGYCIIKLRDK